MSRIGVSSFFCAMLCLPLWGSGRGQTAPATDAQGTTIRTSSDLVVVDVVASDSQQNPVHKLTAADFTLLEDGKPQTVKIFEEHQTQPLAPLPPAPKLDPGIFTNYSIAPANGALNILLLDKLNTPMDAQSVVRDQVLKFLKEVHPGTRIAIFSLTIDLKLLQGFTTNPELLRALVEGKKGSQGASPLMNNAMEGDQPGADDPMYDMDADMLGNDPSAAIILANLQQFEVEQQSFQLQLRARYTLDALNQLARYMSALPGRKNLIWFSGSFPVNILPDPDILSMSAPQSSSPWRLYAGSVHGGSFAGGRIQGDRGSAGAQPGGRLSYRRARAHGESDVERDAERLNNGQETQWICQREHKILPANRRRTRHHGADGPSHRRKGLCEHQRPERGRGKGD